MCANYPLVGTVSLTAAKFFTKVVSWRKAVRDAACVFTAWACSIWPWFKHSTSVNWAIWYGMLRYIIFTMAEYPSLSVELWKHSILVCVQCIMKNLAALFACNDEAEKGREWRNCGRQLTLSNFTYPPWLHAWHMASLGAKTGECPFGCFCRDEWTCSYTCGKHLWALTHKPGCIQVIHSSLMKLHAELTLDILCIFMMQSVVHKPWRSGNFTYVKWVSGYLYNIKWEKQWCPIGVLPLGMPWFQHLYEITLQKSFGLTLDEASRYQAW